MTPISPYSAPPRARRPARALAPLLLLFAGLAIGGCSHADRAVATSSIPVDYHQRHPVDLENTRQTLDVFLLGQAGRLDYRQKHDVEAFAADFVTHGESRIRVLVPRGGTDQRDVDTTLAAVRRALAASGVKGAIEVGSYEVRDPRLASALRMSFVKLQAGLAHPCGEWPDDLGPGSNLGDWENRPWYNLGCANQGTLAAQVDDPRDLVRPRAEEPSDVVMRTRPIQSLRGINPPQPQDPSTVWSQSKLIPIGGQ